MQVKVIATENVSPMYDIGIIDDNDTLREGLRELLEDLGYKIFDSSGFNKVNDFQICRFWIFDNNTNEPIKGSEMIKKFENALLFSADLSTSSGRYIQKPDIKSLLSYIIKHFSENDSLTIE